MIVILLDVYVKQKWNARNVKYFKDKGYEYTKIGDEFDCKVNDLSPGSNILVTVQCDYCGKVFQIKYCVYYKSVIESSIHNVACKDCCELKSHDVLMKKYYNDKDKVEDIKSKRKNTNITKYGCQNVFQNESIKNKIKDTNVEKYGVTNVAQSAIIQEKIKATNIEKYEVECIFQSEEIKQKIKQTCIEKYGEDNYMKYARKLKLYRGDKSHHWKIVKRTQRRNNAEYREFRKQVLERDCYTCQCCHNSSNSLEVHHIQNYSSDLENRYNPDNGIVLCKECHKLFHHVFTRFNNNKHQLNTFIKIYGEKIC